ncbi:unnamed protein product [marine sediment metagenome]|uniref:Uncharacterized protein n=1 Tax=marine sediment metagenome TaxID=412755 RepID=X1TY09_9ZZZZ
MGIESDKRFHPEVILFTTSGKSRIPPVASTASTQQAPTAVAKVIDFSGFPPSKN